MCLGKYLLLLETQSTKAEGYGGMTGNMKSSVIPFWSWNDKLSSKEIEKQIECMHRNGIDGFFMHARGGLRTEYMSQEWLDMIKVGLDKADELGMQAWLYDENGWPSGFADGDIPKLGLEHQQKFLKHMIWDDKDTEKIKDIRSENILAVFEKTNQGFNQVRELSTGKYVFYYMVNPYYIDVFNHDTVAAFLQSTHDKYFKHFGERFGTSIKGFFTDEPQFHHEPWSFVFEDAFEKTYGYELIPNLPLLFYEEEGYEAFRDDFQELISKLFIEAYVRQIYMWCEVHHCWLTGHLMSENNICWQMQSNNGVMACYEYFHIPGMDHLRRKIDSPLQPRQVSSVARQLGRKTITETFALCGWDVSLNELKWIAQWQYVNGVTSLCPHLEGYSLRGARKRDYPASLYSQLPWFEYVYGDFVKYFNTLGNLLDTGKDIAPLLVIHPIHSAYILNKPINQQELQEYSDLFDQTAVALNDEHILYHYGDEKILQNHGSVKKVDGQPVLSIGLCDYSAVLLPNLINMRKETVDMLIEFAQHGGEIYAIGRLPEYENGRRTANIVNLNSYVKVCGDLSEMKRKYPETAPVGVYEYGESCTAVHITMKALTKNQKLLYVTNNEKQKHTITVDIKGNYQAYKIDPINGKEERITAKIQQDKTVMELSLAEYGDVLLVLCDGESDYVKETVEREYIVLQKKFHIDSCDLNAMTLDKCTYQIDGGDWEPEIAVINLQNKLLGLQRHCQVMQKFTFDIAEDIDFDSVEICMEDPEKFEILVNDNEYKFQDNGMYVDHAIRKSKIGEFLKVGTNTIKLSCCYKQSPEVYHAKSTPGIHESVLNKLTYDTELESIYLIGDFAVEMQENYYLGERKCLHGGKTFFIKKKIIDVDITDITHQGFWFFSGKMSLSQKVIVNKREGKKYFISFEQLNAPAAVLFVNDIFVAKVGEEA